MTDAQTPPQADEAREATPLDVASAAFDALIDKIIFELRAQSPNAPPWAVAAMVYHRAWSGLCRYMPPGSATTGLLFTFEQSHPQPMNFVQREQAKKALEAFSESRRKVEAAHRGAQSGIIIPPGVDLTKGDG